MRINVHSTRW